MSELSGRSEPSATPEPPATSQSPARKPFRYRAVILAELWQYGVQPRGETPPELVHEFVSDLYRYEIRRLRSELLRGAFPKRHYSARVVALRQRYGVIGLRPEQWIE